MVNRKSLFATDQIVFFYKKNPLKEKIRFNQLNA